MLIYGESFSGKSTLGMQLAMLHTKEGRPFRVLVFDGEQGGVEDMLEKLEKEGVNLDNIVIIYSQSLNEWLYYIHKAANHEPLCELDEDGNETANLILDGDGLPFVADALLLDGTSVLRLTSEQSLLEMAQRRAKIKANRNGLTGEEKKLAVEDVVLSPREYGLLNRKGQELVLDLSASNLHWVITAREKEEKASVVINGKDVTVNTGKYVFDSFKNIDYNVKTNVRLFRDKDDPTLVKMFVLKDRTHILPELETVDDPNLLVFQELIDKSSGEEVTIKNSMNESVENDIKLYQKSLGLEEDTPQKQDVPTENRESVDDIKKQIKNLTKDVGLLQKKEISEKLKSEGIPTQPKNITDYATIVRFYQICKEVMEA